MKTLQNALLLALCLPLALNLASCDQNEEGCPSCPVRQTCVDNTCQCKPEFTAVDETWCINKGRFVAVFDDWNGVDTTVLGFESPKPDGPPFPGGTGTNSTLNFETRTSEGAGSMAYYPSPNGDSMDILLPFSQDFYQDSEIDDQGCFLWLGGRFVHPDTIRATFRILCDEVSDPLHKDTLNVVFVRRN